MQKAVDSLEIMFQKAETDLNYLSRKLQMENGQGVNEENNPIKLMTMIEEIKSQYSTLTKDISAIQTAQKDTVSFYQSALLTMTQLLDKLESQSESTELAESTAALCAELAQVMGVSARGLSLMPSHQKGDQGLPNPDEAKAGHADSTCREWVSHEACSDVIEKGKHKGHGSDSERRAHAVNFTEVTAEEFMSVSKLVRGKLKLEDLNRTYRMLWQHFKEEGKKESLSPQEMNKMGLRVSGATGDAKLKVLRALKLCQISRNGDVTLP